MREYLQRALERVGYDVVAVGCGTDAMPLLESEHFDLLLTDIVMPEMDGIELAQKASDDRPGHPGDVHHRLRRGRAQGRHARRRRPSVLSKPFHLSDLVAEVDRMFQTEDQHGRL